MNMEHPTRNPSRAPEESSPGATAASGGDALPAARQRRRVRKRVIIPLLLPLVVIGAAVAYWYVALRGVVATDDAYIDSNRVSLSSELLGRIVWLGADEGDTVRQGEVLVRLDDRDLRAQAEHARAALDHAQASVGLAEVNRERARRDLDRATTQFEGHAISQEQFDHARTAVETAAAQRRIAMAQVGSARAQLGVVNARLADTRIEAPFTGVVAKRWVMAGDVVQPGQPIVAIYDVAHVWVTANLEETKLAAIRLGDSVELDVDAYPERSFAGTVTLIGAAAASQFALLPPANASGNFTKVTQRVPIRISIHEKAPVPPQPALLLPGMFVGVHIRVGDR